SKTDLSLVPRRGKWKPSGRNTDASDNRPRLHRRHGQNERGVALNRKNALFAGHDAGAENWATIASLVETCKLNAVDPLAYLTATLTAIVNGHKQCQIEGLLPWNYAVTKRENADNTRSVRPSPPLAYIIA
ncbi:transposase domain-containing protein, partial [Rhizobium leguminosarum]|uniref:transposase domain-containing protein n=1 Tax=Rhizobium leguminosarum TaxID=384 RepID=UPI0021BBFAB4